MISDAANLGGGDHKAKDFTLRQFPLQNPGRPVLALWILVDETGNPNQSGT